jgi:branched-chain amino acid transport system substrate-binding protein
MSVSKNSRRQFITQSAATASALAFPLIAGAQPKTIKIGVLHPVTGALAYSGQQCREGALMAIEDINKAGGIKSLGGAKIEALLGDAQSSPQAGSAEVEKMNEAGVSAIVGAYASAICLHIVDVGVADQIVERGLKNTFRFGPGYRKCAEVAVANLHVLNTAAGKPAKTVMIIHEESLFGTGTANLLARELPGYGYEVKEIIKHANPTRDFNNIVLRMKAVNPDIVIPANYYNEYALLVRTMQQQKVTPKAIFSVLGGAASSYKFVKEFPDAANGIIDCSQRPVLQLRDLHDLHLDAPAGRRDRPRQIHRSRSHHRCLEQERIFGPHHALRRDQIRQRAEPGRSAADDAGLQERHQGHHPARVPRDRSGLSTEGLIATCWT